jgi:hypothetical protein
MEPAPVDFFEAQHYMVQWVPHERHELFYVYDQGPYGALHHRFFKTPAAVPAALARTACGNARCVHGHQPLQPHEVVWCECVDNRALSDQATPSGTWWYHPACASSLQLVRSLVVAASRRLPMPSREPLLLSGPCPARAEHNRLWALSRDDLCAEDFAHVDGYAELSAADKQRVGWQALRLSGGGDHTDAPGGPAQMAGDPTAEDAATARG